MAEDEKTLWVGNLDDKVTEELLYELFLQVCYKFDYDSILPMHPSFL